MQEAKGDTTWRNNPISVDAIRVLAALVGVMDEICSWLASTNGHLQGTNRQRSRHPLRHGPAHDLAGVQVQDGRQVEPPFPRGNVGDVRQPLVILPLGGEVPFQQVRRHRILLVALGGGLVAPDLFGPQATQPHQTRHTILTASHRLGFELAIDTRTPMGLVAVVVHGLDLLDQSSIRHLPSADRPFAAGIVATWRHIRRLAHAGDSDLPSIK